MTRTCRASKVTTTRGPVDGASPTVRDLSVYKVDRDTGEFRDQDITVPAAHVGTDDLTPGYYSVTKQPYSEHWIVTGGAGGGPKERYPFEAIYVGGTTRTNIGQGQTGPCETDAWGTVEAKNIIGYDLPFGFGVSLRREKGPNYDEHKTDAEADEDGDEDRYTWSAYWANICLLAEDAQ